MFELKKVTKARRRLQLITNFLFKLFQINLRYKETRKNMVLRYLNTFTYLGEQMRYLIPLIL